MCGHSLHNGKKVLCRCCLHAFITEEISKCHIKDIFKIDGKQAIKMPKKDKYIKFKNFKRKIKSPFLIYAVFQTIQSIDSFPSKYQKLVSYSCGYIKVCIDDKISKPFKSYLGGDAVYNFISSMI